MLNQPIKPMLLQPSPTVITSKGWLHSLKWDGFRVLIHYDQGTIRAFTREGNEITRSFPELQHIKLNCKNAILDGECICFDADGKPCWEDAMGRFQAKNPIKVKRLSKEMPSHFPVWDVLWVDDQPLLKSSLMNRLEVLNKIVIPSEVISVTPTYDDGQALFDKVKELGLEGIVSKNGREGVKSFYYLDSRPKNVWIKTKSYLTETFQIAGMRKKKFGWSLMDGGRYVGVIEFPPSSQIKKDFYKVARKIVTGENKDWTFIEPIVSCRVKFQAYTKDGKLRSPTFVEFIISS